MAYNGKQSQPSLLPHGAGVPHPALIRKWAGLVTPAPMSWGDLRKPKPLFSCFPGVCLVLFASLAVGKVMGGLVCS